MYSSTYKPSPLIQVELNRCHELSSWFEGVMATEFTLSDSARKDCIAMAFFNLALDHREAVVLLVATNARSSVHALGRSMLDAFVRGVWFREVASDEKIDQFLRGQSDPTWEGMMTGLRKLNSPYATVLRPHYATLSDYAHGSLRQISRWLNADGIYPKHRDEEMVEALWLTSVIGLLAAASRELLAGQGSEEFLSKLQIERQHQRDRRSGLGVTNQ